MSENQYTFNYVIFGCTVDYFNFMYNDLKELSNVRYFSSFWEGSSNILSRLIKRMTFSSIVNRFIKEPFSKFTFRHIYNFNFDNDKPICFIFFETSGAIINSSYMNYLSHRYPGCKKILYMHDLFAKNSYLEIEKVKSLMDEIFSYDKAECEKYNLHYLPTSLSQCIIDSNEVEHCDLYFCGVIKSENRRIQIMDLYNKAIARGLKCIFYLSNVSKEKCIEGDGLFYNKRITYLENLKYVEHSKCVVEIMQDNADGYTLRLWESIIFKKHILTNNESLDDSTLKTLDNIHYIQDGIDKIFDWINDPIEINDDIIKSISPISSLYSIDQTLINRK